MNKIKSELSNAAIARHIESRGKYIRVRIDTEGATTGTLATEDYRYRSTTNTGGRRYIGNRYDRDFLNEIEWEMCD